MSAAAEPLRRRLRARLLRALTAAAGLLPEPVLRAGLAPAAALAGLSEHGRTTRENLARALPELDPRQRERVAREVFRHGRGIVAEWLRLASGAAPGSARGAWIEQRVRLDDSVERLLEEQAAGRGVIVVTAHHGNWELLAAALRRRGLEGCVVGQKRARDSTRDWLVAMRAAYGVETLPQDGPARRLLEVLRGGRLLGLLCDLEVRRLDGEFVPFLGLPALTMTAPAALARASGLPLFPVRCVREGDDLEARRAAPGYVLRVEAPLALDPALPRREATLDLLARMNATFEGWIREAPEQWSWHQPRWRTREGEYEAVPLAARRAR